MTGEHLIYLDTVSGWTTIAGNAMGLRRSSLTGTGVGAQALPLVGWHVDDPSSAVADEAKSPNPTPSQGIARVAAVLAACVKGLWANLARTATAWTDWWRARTDTSTPDDLRLIANIDAALARRLSSLGVRQFAQIAAWTPADVEQIGTTLGIQGRIQRENWIGQAKALISRYVRCDNGHVYDASASPHCPQCEALRAQSVRPAPAAAETRPVRGAKDETPEAVKRALQIARDPTKLAVAADLLESAIRQDPDLQASYGPTLALWRKGISHVPSDTLEHFPSRTSRSKDRET